jgi:response regulator of citrate/malate metabolism
MNNDIEDRVSVLIVEDEMMVAMHLAMMVRNLGHEVVGIAVDSKSAALMAEKQPDLAFVDCNLRDGHTGPDVMSSSLLQIHRRFWSPPHLTHQFWVYILSR